MKKGILAVFVLSLLIIAPAQAQTFCLTLPDDLYPGETDKTTPGYVALLQQYLWQNGYLKVNPNGHFGPSTKAAVKAFQKANGVRETGNVGPATRALLKTKSCLNKPAPTPAPSSSGSPAPTPSPQVSAPSPLITSITSPASGENLTIGKLFGIRWTVPTNYVYDIFLEGANGAQGGYIAHNQRGGDSFLWRVGMVQVAGKETEFAVATGTYRIRIQSSTGMTSQADPVSSWFVISGSPVAVEHIEPQSVVADSKSAVVLYGRGFDSGTRIHLDNEWGIVLMPLYTSTDGTVLVVAVPQYVAAGKHQLYIRSKHENPKNIGILDVVK